jgi:hypothetical protein
MENQLETIINEIYADSKVSPNEIMQLKQYADRAVDELLTAEGNAGLTNALCKSFEVTNQLLQMSLLKLRREKATQEKKDALKNVIESQIELLKANKIIFA